MNAAKIELPFPSTAANDPKAIEIARMWVAHGEQHVAIRVGVRKKPEAWGIVLADLAKHLASAYEQHVGHASVNLIWPLLIVSFGPTFW